jgi:uncharacterized membrane protein
MRYADIQKLHEDGLISEEQWWKIIERYQLKEEGGKFLAILSTVGAVLVAVGITLLIAAHWNEVPRGVKIASGLGFMLGAHAGGWWLRERRGDYRKTGEALHLIGSCLFLANIALLGQVYNLVSRPPNAFLLWWAGIAALPWLLRSKAQFALLLLAFGIWFGFEVNEAGGWIHCESEGQLLLYSVLGLLYVGVGWALRGGSFAAFASLAEKLGLLAFLGFAYPLTWKGFFGQALDAEANRWIFPALAAVAILLLAVAGKHLTAITRQWRWTWFAALLGMTGILAMVWFAWWQILPAGGARYFYWGQSWSYLAGTLGLFIFCLLQIQVGIQERSSFLVNLGVVFVGLDIIAAYLDLFGSMARTGLMFVVGGVFLIGFGVYLETKRRAFMRQIKLQPQV